MTDYKVKFSDHELRYILSESKDVVEQTEAKVVTRTHSIEALNWGEFKCVEANKETFYKNFDDYKSNFPYKIVENGIITLERLLHEA